MSDAYQILVVSRLVLDTPCVMWGRLQLTLDRGRSPGSWLAFADHRSNRDDALAAISHLHLYERCNWCKLRVSSVDRSRRVHLFHVRLRRTEHRFRAACVVVELESIGALALEQFFVGCFDLAPTPLDPSQRVVHCDLCGTCPVLLHHLDIA